MKRMFKVFAVAALGGWALTTAANAAPPTATPSPGYDARLQEQRATVEPGLRVSRPVHRLRAKRIQGTR